MKQNFYYGFEYNSHNRSCTAGNPNKTTGSYNTAGYYKVFTDINSLQIWLGEKCLREKVNLKQLRSLRNGEKLEDFNFELNNKKYEALDKSGASQEFLRAFLKKTL